MLDIILLIACLVNMAFAGFNRNWSALAGWSVALLGVSNAMYYGY